ncbi:hypothetical protein EJ02DRAFT_441252 [Clathrospora elynae]|uniref:DUF202 domain-containing protein n=1 Tax=Clathrospora elynae TaxID=706981 RepID=A0A6A5T2I3_9PLEO|nr:hypothetical protein EJ02DRAFT_441252 [Clathrospora elynae]
MSERTPPPAPPFELPSAALHARTPEAHPDSEEAVRYERRRVSKELKPILRERVATPDSETPHVTPSSISLRLCNTSPGSHDVTSREDLRCHASTLSEANIQPDVPGAGSVRSESTRRGEPRWYDAVAKFWTTHISLTIDEGAHRDHLALERTFLGYLRTSLLLATTGILIAQLFHLQHSPDPSKTYGYYVIGRPLSVTFIAMAILVVLIGAARFWRLQRALVRGKALAGGWEVGVIMGLSAALLVGMFALVLGVDISKTYFGRG